MKIVQVLYSVGCSRVNLTKLIYIMYRRSYLQCVFFYVASDAKKMDVTLGLLPSVFHLGERGRREPALMNRSPPTLMLNR